MTESPEQWKWSSYRATAGKESPHPCLTIDWVLGQFSRKRGKAEQEYRQFVRWGIGEKSLWSEVKGQSILGEDDFVDSLIDHLKKHKDVPEIPRSQRYANRPSLDKVFNADALRNKAKRDKKIVEAVEKHAYSQRQIADHLGLHYATISRIVTAR
jgi:hypothetical protein